MVGNSHTSSKSVSLTEILDKKDVPLSDIAAAKGLKSTSVQSPQPDTWLQKTGVILASIALASICLISILFFFYGMISEPSLGDVQEFLGKMNTKDENISKEDILDTWKELKATHSQGVRDLYTDLVPKVLLPIFTLIIGYIFGERQSKRANEEEDDA